MNSRQTGHLSLWEHGRTTWTALNHMIGEYTRHNGHADLVRQCVDDVAGA